MRVEFRPTARLDVLDAEMWYEDRVGGLGAEFARAVDAAVAALTRFPEGYPKVYRDRVILIGHSMGGDVAVSAARLLEGKVSGLVWVDTYSQLGTARTAEEVTEFLAPFRANFSDTTYDLVRGALFSETASSTLVEKVARDMAAAPPHVAIPSLASSITNDRVVPTVLASVAGLPAPCPLGTVIRGRIA